MKLNTDSYQSFSSTNHTPINLKFNNLHYWNWFAKSRDGIFNPEIRTNSQWTPLVVIPLLATVMLVASIFLLMIFRQNPTLIIGTVASCLVVVTIYLTFTAVEHNTLTFE